MAAGAASAAAPARAACCSARRPRCAQALARNATGAVEVVDAPVGIANDEEPAGPCAPSPTRPSCRRPGRSPRAARDALVSAGSTGAALAAVAAPRQAPARRLPARGRGRCCPSRADRSCCSTSAPTSRCGRSTWSSSPTWAPPSASGVLGCRAPARRPAVGRRGAGEGDPRRRRGAPRSSSPAASSSFVGNVEGGELAAGQADVVVTDGFTGNVALKLMEGTARTMVGAIRDAARSGTLVEARRAAAQAASSRSCASGSTPSGWAAPTCSACAGWW